MHKFTIGQREGINCPAEKPYYVSKLDTRKNNSLIVGFKEELIAEKCMVDDMNWIVAPPLSDENIYTRLRYRQKETLSQITPITNTKAIISFNDPIFPITPGQGAVFFKGDEILGGGDHPGTNLI